MSPNGGPESEHGSARHEGHGGPTNPFSMAGRVALITGASMSIGRSLALAFASQRASIAIHYSSAADAAVSLPDAAQATLADVRARGADGCLVESDLAERGAGRRTVESAIAQLGRVDVLVICASWQKRTAFLDVAEQ